MTKSRAERRQDRSKASQSAPPAPAPRRSPLWTAAIVLLGGGAIAGAVALELTRAEPEPPAPRTSTPIAPLVHTTPAAGTNFVPQPPGEAPPGKVWSPTCGHWHDAVTGQAAQ